MKFLPVVISSARNRAFCSVLSSGFARIVVLSCAAGVLLPGAFLRAQAGRPALVTQAVNEADRVVLSGNTHRLATRAADRGVVPPSTPANRMLLLLRRNPDQEHALRTMIESQHDRNSPNFHKWLTPAQFGAQWGTADSDIAAVTAWLQAHGFKVKGPTTGRTAIEFSGTTGQVQEAFHTSIHQYQVDGEMHHANATDPQIPAALAPVVAGISTLNDFHPRAMAKKGPRGVFDMKTKKVRPALTASDSTGDFLYVGPADAATIYDTPNKALNPKATGGTIDGTGAIIGIIGDSNISTTQNANYRSLFGLAANPPTVIVDGGTDPGENGDAMEAYLDTQVAGGVAPGAQVYFYTAADTNVNFGLDLATLRAVNDNIADVLNMSFSQCEGGLAYAGNQFYEAIWEQAAAQGISVTVSTGDSGSAGCDDPDTETEALYGLQINGIASTPYNIAVGGTDFAALAGPDGKGSDFTKYVSEDNSSSTLGTALGYIPEVPWNNSFSTFPPGNISSNTAVLGSDANIVAAGGGKSNCSQGFIGGNGLNCIAGYPKPSWQSTVTPADNARDIPDVSMLAGNGFDLAAWAICIDQDTDGNGNHISDCTPGSDGLDPDQFYVYGVGGTSASAPAFAGILALVKQSTGERQGQANYVLYNLARTAPGSFHDVATGNNSVPCQQGTADCNKNAAGDYFLASYDAVTGYDLATGLGSVDASALIRNWASSGLSTTTTQLSITPTVYEHGNIATIHATVTGSGGTPTGVVALAADANPPSFPLGTSLGSYTLTDGTTGDVQVNSLPGGTYNVVARYGGSEEFSQSASTPVLMTITPESSRTALTVTTYDSSTGQPSNATPYGFALGLTAHPYGLRSPSPDQSDGYATGIITFTANGTTLDAQPLGTQGTAYSQGEILPAGNYTLAAVYPGDPSFKPSTGTQNLVIAKAATKITLAASTHAYAGKPITFTVQMTTDSAGIGPTGTVTLTNGSTVIAQGPLVGVASSTSALASGSFSVSTSNLPFGELSIKATYTGDNNYLGSVSNVIQIVGKPTFTMADTTIALSSEHSTGAGEVVTTSEGDYAGTINYTCKLTTAPTTESPAQCAMNPGVETLTSGQTVSPIILIFGKGTKIPVGISTSSNTPSLKLMVGAGGAVLACCLFFGIPARRRGWRAMLSAVLLLVAMGGLSACIKTPKFISGGKYIFTVTGVDSVDPTINASATVTVTVP